MQHAWARELNSTWNGAYAGLKPPFWPTTSTGQVPRHASESVNEKCGHKQQHFSLSKLDEAFDIPIEEKLPPGTPTRWADHWLKTHTHTKIQGQSNRSHLSYRSFALSNR